MIHARTRKISNWSLLTFRSAEKIASELQIKRAQRCRLLEDMKNVKCTVRRWQYIDIVIPRSLDNTSKYCTLDLYWLSIIITTMSKEL